jgi:hypothetical protein
MRKMKKERDTERLKEIVMCVTFQLSLTMLLVCDYTFAMAKKTLSCSVSYQEWRQVRRIAKDKNTTINKWLADIVRKELSRRIRTEADSV